MLLDIFHPAYWVVTGIGLLLTLFAQLRVKSTFARYSKVAVRAGMTGAQAAAAVCRAGGADDVQIQRHRGFLSDHYDPRSKTLNLSPDVFDGRSISSIAVAAHEAGHAIQDAVEYPALGFRSGLVPLANIGSRLWFLPFLLGLIFSYPPLMQAGVVLFGLVVLFQFATLPVELDASSRAKAVLAQSGIVATQEEERGVASVLSAAAWTYVAAALTSLLYLIYLIIRIRE